MMVCWGIPIHFLIVAADKNHRRRNQRKNYILYFHILLYLFFYTRQGLLFRKIRHGDGLTGNNTEIVDIDLLSGDCRFVLRTSIGEIAVDEGETTVLVVGTIAILDKLLEGRCLAIGNLCLEASEL